MNWVGMEMAFLFRKRSTGNSFNAVSDGAKDASERRDSGAASVSGIKRDSTLSFDNFSPQGTAQFDVLRGLHILLAEDDEFIGDLLREELSSYGARIQHVLNGKAACSAALASDRPSIVLMDCQMPIMDGFEAAIHIRNEENRNGLPAVPIIALTALDREFDRHHSQKAGIDAYLIKPVYGYQISHAIEKILKK